MSTVEIQHRTGASRSPRSRSIVFGLVLAFSLLVMTVPFAWRILAGRKSTTAVSPPPLDAAPTVEVWR